MENAEPKAQVCREAAQKQKKKGIPGSTVKIIAVVTMLIDHVAAALFTRILITRGLFAAAGNDQLLLAWMRENGVLFVITQFMRLIGRLGFPIFCFLLVEGFGKTRNLKKYIFRLGLFALISEVPFDLAFSGKLWAPGYQNVFFTLLIGILALWGFQAMARWKAAGWLQMFCTAGGILLLPLWAALRLRSVVTIFMANWFSVYLYGWRLQTFFAIYLILLAAMGGAWWIYRKKKGADSAWRLCGDMIVLTAAMILASWLQTDYGGMGVLTVAVMYALRENKVRSIAGGCAVLTVMSLSEATAFFTLIPVARYNGERGLKMKYFFYIFYPAHLLIIWLICWAMGMGWISAVSI